MVNAVEPTDHLDGPIAWREAGTGQPVVFLHGLGGTRTAWGPQLRGLAHGFRCIAWDMPGYGGSAPLEPLTYSGIADSVVALLDTLDIEHADLVGLSFGGMHALHTAIRHPDRVHRMVLANTSPAFGMDGTSADDWRAARLAPLDRGETPADAAEFVVDAITTKPLDPHIRQETIDAFGQISSRGFRAAVECLPTNDVREHLMTIRHESLVIVGERDQETPVSYAQVLANGLANARIEILEGTGHLSPAESPEHFNQLVAHFLT